MTTIRLVPYKEAAHGELVSGWWRARFDQPLPLDVLSESGYVAFNRGSGRPIAALWLYPIKGSKVAWIGWPLADPESNKEERTAALDALYDIIHVRAKEAGYRYIWTTSNTPPVESRLKGYGYVIGDKNVNQYWKILE